MSYLRKAKDLRDRIQGKQQSNAIRTGIRTFRNAARRPGGGGGKTKPGIDLHYKNLQPDREFEAVLDDIDASPDPVFSSSIKEPSHEPEANVPRSRQSVTTESKSHSAPETDTIPPDDEEDGQGKIRGDPLLGVVVTDSEEDSEDLELDAETVNVLESLHLTEKGPGGLVDSAGSKYGSVGPGKEGGEGSLGEKGGEDEKPRLTVNNESVHNNTHILDEEEVGDTLVINSDAHSSKQCDRETSTQTTTALDDKQPTLDELLEHGSAALPTRGYSSSPHRASPLGTPPLLQDSSPSPLASSHETDTTEIFYSITRAYTTPPGHNTRPSTTVPELQHDDNDQKHSEEGHEKTVGQDGAKFTDTSASAHGSSAVDVPVRDKGLLNLRTGDGENKLGLSPASDHPLDLSDEDVVGVAVTENPTCAKTHCVAADGEDELFPDDAKLLQDSAVTSAKGGSDGVKSRSNRLDIREDYFASSPDEQRSKRTAPSHRPPRPSPPSRGKSPSKQNSSGKVAPPRPPRSPQLASRLKLRQEEKAVKNHSSTQPSQYRPFTSTSHKPVVSDRVTVKIVQPLGSAPTGRTNASSTEVEPSTVHGSASLASEVISPVESVTSSVDSAFLHSVTSPLTPVLHKAATTPQQSLDETAPVDINTPPFLPLHIHLLIAGVLYFYYTFNPFVYLAGLMAGFLAFFLSLGAVFVAYVQKEEEEQAATSATTEHSATELSDDFMKSMGIRLEEYETRFIAPSRKHKYRFTATMQYDFATHHRKDRLPCKLKLAGDSELSVCVFDSEGDVKLNKTFDLHHEECRITIVPQDVFENRKRRWNKKYPIRLNIRGHEHEHELFLFANVSRFKQEWFFRLREAARGTTTHELIARQKTFYRYMQRYFPHEPLRTFHPTTSASSSHHSGTLGSTTTALPPLRAARHHHSSQRRLRSDVGSVQFSSTSTRRGREGVSSSGGSISITQDQSSLTSHQNQQEQTFTSPVTSTTSTDHSGRLLSAPSLSTGSAGAIVVTALSSSPEPSSLESNWINALTARLYWDVWHEERWKNWIVSRIQRKLVRIKTPSFLDPLQLTDIAIGNSMPVINRLYGGPYLRPDGVWVYLDVKYEGLFVMTIKTKLKLGRGMGEGEEERGTEMKSVKHQFFTKAGVSHSQAAQALQVSSTVDPDDDSDTGSEDESAPAFTNPTEDEYIPAASRADVQPPHNQKKKEKRTRLKRVVTKITKKVTSNRLVRRAAEKASSVPLELTVEVKRLKGVLAVNIPPPTSDTIWYGFLTTPRLELVAKPRLGKRAVTLSQITHWIERKLCALVDEKLTLPNMEDLVISILNSGLPEDTQKPLSSPDTTS